MRRLIRNEEGGIYGEAVVVLPAFILVWTLVTFVFNGYEQAAMTGADVRREGWAHSQNNSSASDYNEEQCTGSPGSGVSATESNVLATVAGTAVVLSAGLTTVLQYQPILAASGCVDLPIVGNICSPGGQRWTEYLAFIVQKNHYSKTGSIARPIIGGSAQLGHHTYIACDEKEEELGDIEAMVWLGLAWVMVKRRAGI